LNYPTVTPTTAESSGAPRPTKAPVSYYGDDTKAPVSSNYPTVTPFTAEPTSYYNDDTKAPVPYYDDD